MALIGSAAAAVGGYGALAGLVGAGTGLYNAVEGSHQNTPSGAPAASVGSGGAQTVTQQNALDPRMQAILYGDGTPNNPGMLSHITSLQNQPQNAGMAAFGNGAANYLGENGAGALTGMQSAAGGLMNSHINAPQMSAAQAQGTPAMQAAMQSPTPSAGAAQAAQQPGMTAAQTATTPGMTAASAAPTPGMTAASAAATPGMQAAHVATPQGMQAATSNAAHIDAPQQNAMDLSGAYGKMINGDAGANPYLTRALQSGVSQTNAAYQQNQTSATNNLTRNILPGIGSNAVLAGQYGGSRQGIAEGNAISDFTNQQTNANLQLGLANSANTTGQQAAAYNQGQDRSLSAMTGLSGQQYGTATNNAQLSQQSGLANQASQNYANQNNYQGALQAGTTNAGLQQQANQNNYQGQLNSNLANAGFSQQAGQQNYQGNLQTNLANSGYAQQAGQNNYQGLLNSNLANAGYAQQAGQQNYQGGLQTSLFNAGNQQQSGLYNTGLQQQSGLANQASQNMAGQQNYQGLLNSNLANAGYQNAAGQANLQAGLGTNQLNSANQLGGIGASSGLLSSAYNYGNNQQNYDLNHTGAVSGMLTPFTGLGASSATTNPLYSNTMGNVVGGATAGLGLLNAFNGATGGGYKYNTGDNFNMSSNPAYDGNQLFNPSNFAQ